MSLFFCFRFYNLNFLLQISPQQKQDATSNSNSNFNGETNNNNKVIYPWHSLVPFLVTKGSTPATTGVGNDPKRPSGGPGSGPGSGSGPDHLGDSDSFKEDKNPPGSGQQNPDDYNETGSETSSNHPQDNSNTSGKRQKDKIRRPMNAFMIFSKRHRPLVSNFLF